MSAVERALARRARAALDEVPGVPDSPPAAPHAGSGVPDSTSAAPAPDLLDSLRHHLLAGETHYPDRPGMVELRRRVGAALPGIGYPERGPDGVLITASEGESLFVTLLGLGAGAGTRFTGCAPGRHRRLFDWMGLIAADTAGHGSPASAAFRYRDVAEANRGTDGTDSVLAPDTPAPLVHAVGDQLFAPATAPGDRSGTTPPEATPPDPSTDDLLRRVIVIGSLDGLAAMRPFRLGFVAASPETLAGITKWKQASSICSPAPSQRAALWALGVRP